MGFWEVASVILVCYTLYCGFVAIYEVAKEIRDLGRDVRDVAHILKPQQGVPDDNIKAKYEQFYNKDTERWDIRRIP
jgi:hypothetical protein